MSDLTKKENKDLVTSTGAPDLKKMKAQIIKDLLSVTKNPAKNIQPLSEKEAIKPSLQVVMMFDITGSMFPYFDLVRKKLQDIITAVKKESPNTEFAIFAYRNHGDEDNYEQIYYTCPLTQNLDELFAYLAKIEKGGGGDDALTCMEDCLSEANKLHWDIYCPKAIVIIGDMPPHGVIDSVTNCYNGIDYRQEVKKLEDKKVKIYTVYCESNCSKRKRIREFYESLAKNSDGKFLEIGDLDFLVELLIAICLKETGKLDKFIKELETHKNLSLAQRKTILMLKG